MHTVIPALKKQRQTDLCEFETSLVYRVSSRTGFRATQTNPVSKTKNKKIELSCVVWTSGADP